MKTIVYYVNIPQEVKADSLIELAKKMPLKRYQAFLSADSEKTKLQNITAYLLLLKILNDQNISDNNIEFVYSLDDKPSFKTIPYAFNISHCDEMVAVAFNNDIVGIDVERIKEVNKDIIDYVYSKDEQKKYFNLLINQDFFCKSWTIKESYTKALGKGMKLDFSTLSFNLDSNLNIKDDLYINSVKLEDFYMSVCSKNDDFEIKRINFSDLGDI